MDAETEADVIHLCNRTEYSLRTAYGMIPDVLEHQGKAAGICDRGGTWAHVRWAQHCEQKGIKPIFGVELLCVKDASQRTRQGYNYIKILAKDNVGLKQLYELTSLATEKFYYEPRLDYYTLANVSWEHLFLISGLCPDLSALPKEAYIELAPSSIPAVLNTAQQQQRPFVATADNYYPAAKDFPIYQVAIGRTANSCTNSQHIITEAEWRIYHDDDTAVVNTYQIADNCNAQLPQAHMVTIKQKATLRQMCVEGAKRLGVNLDDAKYKSRLDKELKLIKEKQFENYFLVVADLCNWAHKSMLVGPARGSSCGSLVCYLIGITTIDPLPYDLLFERFIDVNRIDPPDIDIDFPDERRGELLNYLRDKYGHERVCKLGTISRFKAKSALTDVARVLRIPLWEIAKLKNAILKRSLGDARAAFCIMDAFDDLEVGKATLAKYPELRVAQYIEGHARHAGQHAAGILITAENVDNYGTVNRQIESIQLEKTDAESLGMLKIDVLGLRVLSVIQDTLDQIGWPRSKLIKYPLDDEKAFAIINDRKFTGIFQFEGYGLQNVSSQIHVSSFEDLASITALSRPGPVIGGNTKQFTSRHQGKEPVEYIHPMVKDITEVTYGTIVYQEQVMQIARQIGKMSWQDVSSLRKAMSRSLGMEFFDKFWAQFESGAKENGIDAKTAKAIWDKINAMGSWSFNRSHAIAYGTLSYWCCVLKAHYPLEFALACLQHAKDDEQTIFILRELVDSGYEYASYDAMSPTKNWSLQDGKIVGGLLGIHGIGEKTADDIIKRKQEGKPLTKRQQTLLEKGTTPWDVIFECKERWGHIIENPIQYNIQSPITQIRDMTVDSHGTVVFMAKVKEKNLRDANETIELEKRKRVRVTQNPLWLNFIAEDDTSSIFCTITRKDYQRLGKPIVERDSPDDWYLFKGANSAGYRRVVIQRWVKLTDNKRFQR